MSPKKPSPDAEKIAAKYGRCEGTKADGTPCNGTELVCRLLGRDTRRPCCPSCTHENGWKPAE